ncbi:MAG: hypothetical protein RM049_36365 [Nostoc sp. DedQUE04]|uniref:hypothetical protein n=1 Tax=Nostoc sp. DedQUE04 TaxID=3075390 RepID=UPI002AD3A826|nr:hypothetical protein [Nostoc sp. DedQUE04]MDZ8140710.1 hypothetical protein [Nostoc sp. DedQUE04]
MSNYLNQLVAKNLKLVDTVQPFLLSIFGFLPESVPEMGSEESWGINQEIVMGGGDSAITTELETSPQTQILANSDIMQPLKLQAMAVRTETLPRTTNTNQLQTSGDINNPPSTSLTPGLTHYWKQPPTATSFLADKSDSQPSSSQPESVAMTSIMQEVKDVLDTQPLTLPMAVEQPTTALYKIGMKNEPPKPQEIDLQVHTEHQIIPEIVNTPITFATSNRQEVVKNHPAVSLTMQEMVSSEKSLTMPELEPVVIEPTSDKVLPTVERQPLRLATPNPLEDYRLGSRGADEQTSRGTEITSVILHQEGSSNVEAITPLSVLPVKSHKQPVPFLSKEPGIEINRFVPSSPSSKVMRAQVDSHQSQPQSVAIAPDRSFVQGAETQQSTPAPTLETNTRFPAVTQLTQPATESLGQQAVKSHAAVSLTVQEMVSSGQSLTMPESEPVVIRTSDKVLPTVERQPLRSATPNPPEDYRLGSRGAEITSVILHQEESSNVEAITPLSALPVKSHKQPVLFLSKEPGIEINRFVPSSPSSKVMRAQVDSHQSQPQSVAIAPDRSFVQGAETQQSTPAPTLETNIRFPHPAVAQLTQPATESLGQQAVKIHPSDSRPLSPKAIGSEQSRNQLNSEPVSRERTSVQVPRQEIVSVQPTSLFQDRPLGTPNILPDFSQNRENLSPASPEALNSPPNHDGKGSRGLGFALSFPDEVTSQNILQPINDDSRRGSVFLSASRQEQRQGESFGNSTTPPTIKVSIGSMEIRTPSPIPPPPRPKARPKPPVMSLDEYLRQRSRGR